jgi:hypothetical protein
MGYYLDISWDRLQPTAWTGQNIGLSPDLVLLKTYVREGA